ncbi:MAG: tetratricopeptide repeat protein [Candidatus Brocadiales bacterium]|nr:tetratricopeptide repeat protein [Candidatus Brocadiales bacterium]
MTKLLNNNTELQEALKLHQGGNLDGASILYNKILEEQPDSLDTISLLSTLNLQAGNLDAACVLLTKSTELKPDNAIAHGNLGSALHASGRFEEAMYSYKRAIELKPDYVEAYYNLGSTLQALNLLDEAIVIYKLAIDLNPNDADIHNNLGNALRKSGKPGEALNSYKQASMLKPHNADTYCNLGAALQGLGNLDEAILNYKKAISLRPDNAKAHNNLGTTLKKQCRLEEAVKSYNRAIELSPDYAEAYNNLGNTLQSLNRLDEAITSYRTAITIKPHFAEAHYNCGNARKEQKKFDEAFVSFKRAITIKPDYAEAHNNLGITFQERGEFVEAAACYSRAIELKPDYADAHFNRSLMSLLKGNFKDGWQEYEWRLHTKGYAHRSFQQPMWDGSPLNGKTILIHTEQGMGDNIQFVRYLPMVQARGGRVIFECLPALVHLLKNCAGIDAIILKDPSGKLSERFDVHSHLLSIPSILDTGSDTIPSSEPYITPDSTRVIKWRDQLEVHDKSIKIGLVWASSPDNKELCHKKSCKLNYFEAISGIPDLSFYSLQKGPASAEIHNAPKSMKIINLDNELNDFADTAAVIANLDVVISVDTSVAHLAGAIGKPVWTLLPFVPDWRWQLERDDSPWYPSMRLFRQTKLYDWDGVFERVAKSLSMFRVCNTNS